MAIAVESYSTPSNKAPEPYIDVVAPRSVATPARTTGVPTDSVKLSLSAQIHLLKNRGISDKQIAIALNVDTATVASYLGSTGVASAAATIPAAATTK